MRLTIDKQANGDRIARVWLDERRTIDGEPDPDWITEWTWGAPPEEQTEEEYEVMIRDEVKLMAEEELAVRRAKEPVVTDLMEGERL